MNGWPKYFRKMRGVLARSGCGQAEIEDLMQDATVCLLEYYRHGVEVREPEAVLVRTVRRLALNHYRDAHSDLYTDCPPEKLELIDPGPTPEEVVLAEQCLNEMRRTLDAVSRRTREVVFLQRIHGYSYAQIAREMAMPVSTVEKHIARAMTVLLAKQQHEMHRS
jgi:RNA polymerase sigma-70 factor (ECF subfamily)